MNNFYKKIKPFILYGGREEKDMFPVKLFEIRANDEKFESTHVENARIIGKILVLNQPIPGSKDGFAYSEREFSYIFDNNFQEKFKVNTQIFVFSPTSKNEEKKYYAKLSWFQRQKLMWAFNNHWFQQEKNLRFFGTSPKKSRGAGIHDRMKR